ncbi:hypothetical protein BDV98DRAFT_138131 [Pterulicium gracile]|uniref:Uncharacterized protein n=1 Tax=Pterulicium gracile TaxID=1884261 RepID=A0A5C3QZ55_9AGAR|nr:hypothetical protein BDV98DRAFT_138131 [Pterula gracilis]
MERVGFVQKIWLVRDHITAGPSQRDDQESWLSIWASPTYQSEMSSDTTCQTWRIPPLATPGMTTNNSLYLRRSVETA